MPRNVSGFYTLPLPPVVPGTVIESVWANTTLDDLAQAITNSLSRDGQGGMNAPFRIADGTVVAPGLAFVAETGSGLFRESAGVIGMSVLGVKRQQWTATGSAITGNLTVSGTINSTGVLTVPLGTALLPGLTFTGDPNTGWWSPGADSMAWSTGGVERLRIGTTGEVGIGGPAGLQQSLRVSRAITGATTSYGILSIGQIAADVTTAGYAFASLVAPTAAAFTLGTFVHYYAAPGVFGAGSAVTNQYGFMAQNSLTGAVNNYGFFANIGAGAGRWNFYAANTADNFFAGNVGIGAGNNLPAVPLHVFRASSEILRLETGAATGSGYMSFHDAAARKAYIGFPNAGDEEFRISIEEAGRFSVLTSNIQRFSVDTDGFGVFGPGAPIAGRQFYMSKQPTGAVTSYGFMANGAVQPDVTTAYNAFYSGSTTQAAAFNLTTLAHFIAVGGNPGAGSSITNQFGFTASANLTLAANNYGFWAGIPAAAGRYNFYAAGDAANFFSGQILAGGLSQPFSNSVGPTLISTQFQIAGSSAAASALAINQFGNNSSSPGIYLGKSRNAAFGGQGIVTNGDMLGLLGFNGSDGVQMRDAGRVALFVDGVPAAGSMPGKLSFQTTPFGSTAPVERMSIGSYGIIYMAPVVGVESAQTPTLSLGSTNITQAFTRTGDGTLDTIGVGPTSNLASTGGGLCVIRGADSTGQAFVRLYAYIGIVAGGATPVAATLIGSAGAVAPSFALSMVNVGGNNRLRWTGSNTTGGIWWVSYFCT